MCLLFTFAFVTSASLPEGIENQRIWLKVKINNKSVRLLFDTGSNVSVLPFDTATKLGLRITNNISPEFAESSYFAGETSDFEINVKGSRLRTRFLVFDQRISDPSLGDGLLSWATFSPNIIRIDGDSKELMFLGAIPSSAYKWNTFPLLTNYEMLDIVVACKTNHNKVLCVDTGDPRGLALPVDEWNRWKKKHKDAPTTIELRFSPTDGFTSYRETWADEISIGPLVLHGIALAESGRGNQERLGVDYGGTLGIAGLARLNCIVDGIRGIAYIRSRHNKPNSYDHNRLGAVFVPGNGHDEHLVAVVIEKTPAYEAGIRNGDILLQLNGASISKLVSSWENGFHKPAGTRIEFVLKRGDKKFTSTAVLRDIIGVENTGRPKTIRSNF